MQKINHKLLATGLTDGVSLPITAASGVVATDRPHFIRKIRLQLTSKAVSMAAANDFGGSKIGDLPATNLIVLGVVVDLAVTVAGLAVNTAAALDVAVGTATTASTDFSNAGEDNLMAKVDGVGGTATGTVKGAGASDGALANVLLAAGAKAVYLNASSAVTSGTGTATFTGWVDVFYIDLGDHSA